MQSQLVVTKSAVDRQQQQYVGFANEIMATMSESHSILPLPQNSKLKPSELWGILFIKVLLVS